MNTHTNPDTPPHNIGPEVQSGRDSSASGMQATSAAAPARTAPPGPVSIVLGNLPAAGVVRIETPGHDPITIITRPTLAYTLPHACDLLEGPLSPDTLRAQLERSGVQIGGAGRTAFVSIDQLRAGLKLAA